MGPGAVGISEEVARAFVMRFGFEKTAQGHPLLVRRPGRIKESLRFDDAAPPGISEQDYTPGALARLVMSKTGGCTPMMVTVRSGREAYGRLPKAPEFDERHFRASDASGAIMGLLGRAGRQEKKAGLEFLSRPGATASAELGKMLLGPEAKMLLPRSAAAMAESGSALPARARRLWERAITRATSSPQEFRAMERSIQGSPEDVRRFAKEVRRLEGPSWLERSLPELPAARDSALALSKKTKVVHPGEMGAVAEGRVSGVPEAERAWSTTSDAPAFDPRSGFGQYPAGDLGRLIPDRTLQMTDGDSLVRRLSLKTVPTTPTEARYLRRTMEEFRGRPEFNEAYGAPQPYLESKEPQLLSIIKKIRGRMGGMTSQASAGMGKEGQAHSVIQHDTPEGKIVPFGPWSSLTDNLKNTLLGAGAGRALLFLLAGKTAPGLERAIMAGGGAAGYGLGKKLRKEYQVPPPAPTGSSDILKVHRPTGRPVMSLDEALKQLPQKDEDKGFKSELRRDIISAVAGGAAGAVVPEAVGALKSRLARAAARAI